MGESRGGEGRAAGPTVAQIAQHFVRTHESEGREVERITVQFATKGLYGVSITFRGEPEPESFFLYTDEPDAPSANGSPSGGSVDRSEGS